MEEQALELTPRLVYKLLTGGLPSISKKSVLDPKRKNYRTMTNFWWSFLTNFADYSIVDPYFDVSEGRSRSLTTIMNHGSSGALPIKLQNALQEGLIPDNFISVVHWVEGMILSQVSPQELMRIINAFQDACYNSDFYFSAQHSFFDPLRDRALEMSNIADQLALMNAVRLVWLGLHALFGSQMHSQALVSFRKNPSCDIDAICSELHHQHAVMGEKNADLVIGANPYTLEDQLQTVEAYPDGATMQHVFKQLTERVPHPVSVNEARRRFDGWYLVSAWVCDCIALNSDRMPTYRGAELLAIIPNGQLLYVTDISDYQGLHKSPGHWGYTVYKGIGGYVPVNMLQRITIPQMMGQ